MLNVNLYIVLILGVNMPNDVVLNDIVPSVAMLSAIMLSVILIIVVMLIVVAPFHPLKV
jgi:hypothetical protein